jgi:hypothetical protein
MVLVLERLTMAQDLQSAKGRERDVTDNFSTESSGMDDASPLGPTGERASTAYNWRGGITVWKVRLKTLFAWRKTRAGISATAIGTAAIILGVFFGVSHSSHSVSAPVRHWGEAVVFPIDGIDQAGRKASFDLVLMPKDYTWALGSSTELALRGVPLSEAEAAARVFSPEVLEGLQHSPEVIAVGVASQEGEPESERGRAERRAKSQAQLIAKSVSPLTGIWLLNLGQYNEECNTASAVDTSWQRPVMLVGVRSQQLGVVLAQALENAISGKSNIPSRECYSSFTMVRNR